MTLTTKTVTVVDQNVSRIAGQRWGGIALAVQPRFRVALGFGRGATARLATPVLGRTAIVRTVFATLGPVAGSSMEQRVVQPEVFARLQAALLGHLDGRVEQFGDGIVLDEPVAVLTEDRVIPHAVFDGQSDEPAKP